MNLLQISLLNRYIYSPQTWLHKLNSRKKIHFLFIYLFIILYTNSIYISISAIIYFILFLYYKILENYNMQSIVKYSLVFCTIFYISLLLKPQFLYFFIKLLIDIKNIFISIKDLHILYFRTILLIIHYIIVINIIFITTMYEDIIVSFLILCKKYKNNIIWKITFISSFASQSLERINLKVQYIIVAIRIKKLITTFRYDIYMYLILKLLQEIYSDLYLVSSLLYSRELNYKILDIKDIYI
uniref:hypothetical protein n=1 Tax=Gracilariopsis tenuifrons TaxID=31472 RepID=UPI001D10F770|nr:hypothetical protein LK036_pgp125 [Gracilariopsis tenuifrons]UAD89240.1 hypothetical protein [Gracilariopsis tenuifrons]